MQAHLGETEIPIGETELIRVSSSGYVKRTRWCGIENVGGAEFEFWFRSYVDVRKYLRVLEHITKHRGVRNSLSNTSSLLDSIGFS